MDKLKQNKYLVAVILISLVGSVYTAYNSKVLLGVIEFFLSLTGSIVLYSDTKDVKNKIVFYLLSMLFLAFSISHAISDRLNANKIDTVTFTEQEPAEPVNDCKREYNEKDWQIKVSDFKQCEKNHSVQLRNYKKSMQSYNERKQQASETNSKASSLKYDLSFNDKVFIVILILLIPLMPAANHGIIKAAAREAEERKKVITEEKPSINKRELARAIMHYHFSEEKKSELLASLGISAAEISKLRNERKRKETPEQLPSNVRKFGGNSVAKKDSKNALA